MHSLPNGCSRSAIKCIPSNWNTANASIKKNWKIYYRFYDPAFKKTKKWGWPVQVKGMNHLSNLADRQAATTELIDLEKSRLEDEGYNPITGICRPPMVLLGDLGPETSFINALDQAYKRLECSPGTKDDIRIALVPIKAAIRKLKFDRIPIGEIKIRNVVLVLETVGVSKGGWTPSNFNHFRTYLLMLFTIIVPLANMQGNPVRDIVKKKEIKKKKDVLNADQRKLVNEHLQKKYYTFWRFLHIFFHSGSRISELMRLKETDIEIGNQRFKVLVKKGQQYFEVWKPIKNIILPLWKEVFAECQLLPKSQPIYLFSRNLIPGYIPVNEIQITRRWRLLVKQKLGITADFYSLKHLNSTETSSIREAQEMASRDAAAMNSHTSTAMVVRIYDTMAEERQNERLKEINNPFA